MNYPTKIGTVIFPGFQLLDICGPLDALTVLALKFKLEPLAIIAESLETVSSRVTDTEWNQTGSRFGASLVPTHTFETAPDDLEVLFIPGGIGTRAPALSDTVAYVKGVYPRLHSLIAVCTGTLIAGQAGLLDGRHATANKVSWEAVTTRLPDVKWDKKPRWVKDGNVWTSGGVSAVR